jgi:hypothetical protein
MSNRNGTLLLSSQRYKHADKISGNSTNTEKGYGLGDAGLQFQVGKNIASDERVNDE